MNEARYRQLLRSPAGLSRVIYVLVLTLVLAPFANFAAADGLKDAVPTHHSNTASQSTQAQHSMAHGVAHQHSHVKSDHSQNLHQCGSCLASGHCCAVLSSLLLDVQRGHTEIYRVTHFDAFYGVVLAVPTEPPRYS